MTAVSLSAATTAGKAGSLTNRQRLGHNAAMSSSRPLQHRDDRTLRIAAAVVAAIAGFD